jgi:hypothetical protein
MEGAAVKGIRLLVLVLDVLLLAVSVVRGGALVEGLRIVLVIVAGMCGAVVVFGVVILAVAVVGTIRQPPYGS